MASEMRSIRARALSATLIMLPAVVLGAGDAWGRPVDAPLVQERPLVCAQVVLALDASASTGDGAFHRQIGAFEKAFRREALYQAVQDCLPGSVAFAITTWSGPSQQDLCLDWSVVMTAEDGREVAQHLKRCRYFGGTTDIGRAVDHGLRALAESPFASHYRVVFLLTNGRTDRNAGAALATARARATEAGVTLAAHALLHTSPDRSNPFFVADAVELDRYVAEQVSAGTRTFTSRSRPDEDLANLLGALVEMLRQEGS